MNPYFEQLYFKIVYKSTKKVIPMRFILILFYIFAKLINTYIK